MESAVPTFEEASRKVDWSTGCPVCASQSIERIFHIDNIPASDGAVWPTYEQAISAPVGTIDLWLCTTCGYVANREFNPEKLMFSPLYEISLHHSPTYHRFIEEVCHRLIERYGMQGRKVIEIGCGRGYFLELFCRISGGDGVGFDPSVDIEKDELFDGYSVKLVRDFFNESHAEHEANLYCCRHVLQEIASPALFLKSLRRTLGDRDDVVLYFEVPNGSYIFERQSIWSILYEYNAFFSPETFARLFRQTGFEVLHVAPCYQEGQYLGIEVRPNPRTREWKNIGSKVRLERFIREARAFAHHHALKTSFWKDQLGKLVASRKKIAAWGAGGRAITFFSLFGIGKEIPVIVDINPDRQGAYLPGTGQQIVPPEFLSDMQPQVLLISNPTYKREIRRQVLNMGLNCAFLNA